MSILIFRQNLAGLKDFNLERKWRPYPWWRCPRTWLDSFMSLGLQVECTATLVIHPRYYLTHLGPNIEMNYKVCWIINFLLYNMFFPTRTTKLLHWPKLYILGYCVSGSASFNSPNANLMQNKRVVRGNTYAQRVPIRSFNVSSTLEDRDFHCTPGTPGLMQRKFQQRNQLLPNLANGEIQVQTSIYVLDFP